MNDIQLLHTQLGFRPGDGKKRIIVADSPGLYNIFGAPVYSVAHQQDFSSEVLNSDRQHTFTFRDTFRRHDGDFGRWMAGDISPVTKPGCYQAYSGRTPGPTFVIHDDVWCRIVPDCIRYFQVQSCGREVAGYHDACHLDDGYVAAEDRYIDASGGWHDAGDFRKWATSTAMIPIALLMAHRIWKGREDRLGLAPGVLLSEALRGADYFLRVQQPDGSVIHNVGGGELNAHANKANRYTDNVPRSGDERLIVPGTAAPAGKFTTLFALFADAAKESDAGLSSRCLQAATRSLAYGLAHDDGTADQLQWRAWGHLELWRVTGDEQHKTAAADAMAALLDLQVTEYAGGQTLTRGYFRAGPSSANSHRKHVGAGYVIWALGQFLDAWPDHADASRWRDAVALWADDFVRVFADRTPFGVLPYALYEELPAGHANVRYRRIGERLWFRYFLASNGFGNSARCAIDAAGLSVAARVLSRPELLDDAYRLLDWVLGANPFQLSMMSGVGVRQACAHSLQMGLISGGVMNGIGGDENDMPTIGAHPWSCNSDYFEYYGYNTSQFFWAVTALQDLGWATA